MNKPRRRQPREGEQERELATQPSCIGHLAAGSKPTALLVDFDGNAEGPLPARSTIPLDEITIQQAVATRRGVLLTFDRGNARAPIVTGLIEATEAQALLGDLLTGRPKAPQSSPASDVQLEARVDGETVIIEGRQQIVLKCGRASITLSRDGKVVLKGAYIETDADGVNRIKGGAVKIN